MVCHFVFLRWHFGQGFITSAYSEWQLCCNYQERITSWWQFGEDKLLGPSVWTESIHVGGKYTTLVNKHDYLWLSFCITVRWKLRCCGMLGGQCSRKPTCMSFPGLVDLIHTTALPVQRR